MLRLERMEISGFKSFSDRTDVRFPQGITAVVGPNGCGKSNIGDAINWVLGEQSPRMLRGKQMADVIFAGSAGRKPLGMAEVSLTLGGAEGIEGAENGIVKVTRRLFRSGESDYLVNGKRARLKDIQELLERAHVGARTYATIEQGRIDQILNAKPKDRRLIIEDAAGIAGYKHKRRLTELKLEATHANLLRVNDIVVEVERQIRSLKRQAGKARRYRRLREEMRSQEAVRFAARSRALDAELAAMRLAETAARDAEAGAAAELVRLEMQLVEERRALEAANQAYRETSERLYELEKGIDREEAQIRTCRERIDESEVTAARERDEAERLDVRLGATRERLGEQQTRVAAGRADAEQAANAVAGEQAQLDEALRALRALREEIEALRRRQFETMNAGVEARNSLRAVEEALERNRAQQARLESERSDAGRDLTRLQSEVQSLAADVQAETGRVESLRAACAAGETSIAAARRRQTEETDALTSAREEEKSAAARLATLEDVATRFAGVSDGVRTLLSQGRASGLRTLGVVADFIEAGADFEAAAEGYLDAFLPTVILEEDSDVSRAAEMLRAEGAGRTSLISRSQPAGALAVGTNSNGHGPIPPEVLGDPRVQGRLRDRITLRTAANGVLGERVGDALLVDELATALELHRRFPAADYLTPEGDVVFASGVVHAGGRRAGDRGLLAHNRQIEETRVRATAAGERGATLQRSLDVTREAIVALEVEQRERREALDSAAQRLAGLEAHARHSRDESERTGRRTDVLGDELSGIVEEGQRLRAALPELHSAVELAEQAQRENEGAIEACTARLAEHESAVSARTESAAALREELAARRQRQETLEQEGGRLTHEASELAARVDGARGAAEAALERAAAARRLLETTETSLLTHLEERKSLAERTGAMEREIADLQSRLAERETGVRGSREALDARRTETRDAELARTRTESVREHLDELCRQELGIGADEAAERAAADGTDLVAVDADALERRVSELREQIEALGPVNMTAIEEFAELEERHGFLTTQREDLDKAMTSLKETIRRINRSSRERFIEAFEAVRVSYQEIFQLLFNGGRADLRLEEGEDVLECGIEILAQPPGKRLGNINLLSGGEKALSAIALLFAVFRYQPSPFCLLDEVDAALDESNVGRFTRMLGEYAKQTQFIIVTHNKLTMESADLLYGVTMEEPGVSRLVSMQLQ